MREQFCESSRYVKAQWKKLLLAAAVFFLLAAGTAVTMAGRPEECRELMAGLQESMESVLDEEGNVQVFHLFANNLTVAGIGVLLGFIPFFMAPMYIIVSNGAVMGLVYGFYLASADYLTAPVWKIMLVGILPHGIFELGAIFLSVALGVQLCLRITGKLLGRKGRPLKEELTDLGWAFVLWVTPLLIAAALLECYLTPVLMNWLL